MDWLNSNLGLIQSVLGVLGVAFAFYLKKSFVPIREFNAVQSRLQTVEQTYATSEQINQLHLLLKDLPKSTEFEELERDVKQLSRDISSLTSTLEPIKQHVSSIFEAAIQDRR